jgi:hypothetical protein
VSWTSRFLPVHTHLLQFDRPTRPTDKATPAQLQQYARNVGTIYELINAGMTRADFDQMMHAPLNAREASVATTYRHLFTSAPAAQRFEAEFIEGRGLVITRGAHRIEAARSEGVAYVPVHVRTRTEDQADRITVSLIQAVDPAIARYHQDQLPARSRTLLREVAPDPERSIEVQRDRER